MQWSQSLIFFGLLSLYFANLHPSSFDVLGGRWQNMMIFLNVFSVASVTCSLGARFVYPQLSLEGQGFWMLGLAPISMRRVVLTKFVGSAGALAAIGMSLMAVASHKLETDPLSGAIGVALAGAVAVAVCGLSTGLGAVFLDLKQRNPAAIVSGFGGTLNLVLSLLFLLSAIVPFAALFHLRNVYSLAGSWFNLGLAAGSLWLIALTAVSAALPLWLGIRSLSRRDF
jgi:ABC-2 type transport system permease protein